MKKHLPFAVLLLALAYVGSTLRAPRNPGVFDVQGFGRQLVLVNGRLKPLDTVARSSLLQLQGRQTVRLADGRRLQPIEWLLDVAFRPEVADAYQHFEIVHPDVLAVFDLRAQDGQGEKRFSLRQLQPKLGELQRQARLADQVEGASRTRFQRAILQLYGNLVHYQRLRHAFVSPERTDFLGDLLKLQENLTAGVAAVRAKQAGQPHDEALAKTMTENSERFSTMAEATTLLAVPPATGADPTAWKSVGSALLDSFATGSIPPTALAYAGFAHAWRQQQPAEFNRIVQLFRADLEKRAGPEFHKGDAEVRFNSAQPFYTSMILYALAFLAAVVSWLVWPTLLGRSAFWLVTVAWVVSTLGIGARMWLEGRPPVTNLYSSALFVGWGAVGLCVLIESIYRNAVGNAAAGAIGFATLVIAHHLSLGGDTMEMMRAVLDSNFWLATHVVVITAGYSATFLAGFLAMIYIIRGVCTRSLDAATAESLTRMVYGIVCFATLFSFVGTILGGIWADQSWGRFWGWDPKENGALILVLWNAIILHARWGGLIGQRGLMNLAVGGNIVTGWSWFGTNMLGVGLHSYGFTDAAFVALTGFVASQLAIIALGNLPLHVWRSAAPLGAKS